MPVSRNRKKKYKPKPKPKPARPKCIHELFGLQIKNCRKCGEARDKLEFDELPKEEQLHWDEAGIQESIDFILYCPGCEQYSALLKTEEI